MNFKKHYVICALLIAALLTACSNKEVNQPVKLKKIKSPIKVEKLWRTSVGTGDDERKLDLRPDFYGNEIFTIDTDGEVSVLNAQTGDDTWTWDLDEQVSAGIAVDQGNLYYATFQGELVAFDRTAKSEKWRKKLTSEAVSAPVTDGQSIIIQTIDGKLFAFNAQTGAKRWRYDSIGPVLSLRGNAKPVVIEDRVIASFANGEMAAIDKSSGFLTWKADIGIPQGRTELERLVDLDGDPVVRGSTIFATGYQGKLAAVDSYSGRELWSKPFSSYQGVGVDSASLYAVNHEDEVFSFKLSNASKAWKSEELKYRRLSTPVSIGAYVAISDFEGYVHFLDSQSGEIKARIRPDRDGVMHMTTVNNTLYVYTRDGDLYAYQLPSI